MTNQASEISAYSDPILFDKIAQEINTALNSKFDDQYPVCWTRTEDDLTVPEVYKNDGSKIDFRVMPNETRSMSFFTVEGELTEIDESDFACPMAISCWANLQKYDNTKLYDYTAELIRYVLNVLNKYGCYDLSVNVNDPFENFSMLQKEVDENTQRPYSAFKILFTKTVRICDS